MFVLNFVNLKENHEVDSAIEEHQAFLERYTRSGHFLVSGKKVPRTGGIIIVQGLTREQVDAIVAEAPFAKHGFARIEVTEFKAIYRASGLVLDPIESQ